MNIFVFDSDGLIKVVHSGIFEKINTKCVISQQVYEEVVEQGKRRLYFDAFQIERWINENKIKVIKVKKKIEIPGLGSGELSTLTLYKEISGKAIVSDDRRFLQLLEQEDIPFIIPTGIIVSLFESKRLSKGDALDALSKIKVFVRNEDYENAAEIIGG